MGDIAIIWDPVAGRGDWAVANGDLASGQDLQTAILLSLFTDCRVDDYVAPAPTGPTDPRGCWTDTYTGFSLGSRLWTRTRLIKTPATLQLIKGDMRDALDWLIQAGVVASFDVDAAFVNRTGIALAVTAHMPVGNPQRFQFQRVWGEVS